MLAASPSSESAATACANLVASGDGMAWVGLVRLGRGGRRGFGRGSLGPAPKIFGVNVLRSEVEHQKGGTES